MHSMTLVSLYTHKHTTYRQTIITITILIIKFWKLGTTNFMDSIEDTNLQVQEAWCILIKMLTVTEKSTF